MNASSDIDVVRRFLVSAATHPSALIVEGELGIGKTTLWLAANDDARRAGFRVLSTRAGEAESQLDFVGLHDLIGDVETDVIERLPTAQQDALERILMRASGPGGGLDPRSVAAAFTAIVGILAQRSPVLIAVDDGQWIDPATRDVLAYAVCRVQGRVGVLVTERVNPDRPDVLPWLTLDDPDRVVRLRIGPMSLGRLHRVLSSRIGRSFPRPTMTRIAEISGGNPFYALELAHALDSAESLRGATLPTTLIDMMRLQLGHFDDNVQQVLLAAACLGQPTVELLAAVVAAPIERAAELIDEAGERGIVVIEDGRVRFTHPLLAHGAYSQALPADRRRIHRAVAEVEPVLERKARHMALAATTGDPETLLALDSAADAARAKAVPTAAAELLELAIGLGGDTPTRRVNAAHNHLLAGDVDRSLALVEPIEAALPAGPLRARARMLRGGALTLQGVFVEAVELLRAALADAADDPALTVSGHLSLSMTLAAMGDVEKSAQHVRLARTRAEEFADTRSVSRALAARALLQCMSGADVDEVALQRAIDLERRDDNILDTPAPFSARIAKALVASWTGRLVEARTELAAARDYSAARASDVDMLWVQFHSAMVDIWLGRYGEAAGICDDMLLGAEQLGGVLARVMTAAPRALVAAYTGRVADARAEVELVFARASGLGETSLLDWPRMVLGFLEVSLGDHAAAMHALQPLLTARDPRGPTEILSSWFLPDAIEAAFALGRTDEFEVWVAALEANGARLNRPWMIAVGARCRCMLLAARGELAAAEIAAATAVRAHDGLAMPFERARTLLVVGQLQRRRRQKHSAGVTLAEALRIFEALGASLWADRARAELSRVSAATASHGLTASEFRVAELVASGMTNKDVATAMYISPKTVEHNLGRIYRKLGIRSRAELGSQIDALRDGSD